MQILCRYERWPNARNLPLSGANFEPNLGATNFTAGLASFLSDAAL
jgi:hypothetical protein